MEQSEEDAETTDTIRRSQLLDATRAFKEQPADRWREIINSADFSKLGFSECRKAWSHVFEKVSELNGPHPCWVPDSETIRNSNLGRWMSDLEMTGLNQFYKWSIDEREAFWEMALECLPIAFRKEPESIFGKLPVPESPNLLEGAKLNIVESCFQASPDQVAVISGRPNGDLIYQTYGELQRAANQVSNLLLKKGLKRGDRVGLILPITFDSIAIYLGLIQAGLVAVSIADSFAAPEIANRLKIANAQAVVTCRFLTRAGKDFELAGRVEQATDLPIFLIDKGSDFLEEVAAESQDFEALTSDPLSAINILFSSGTTGDPKAIPWNHTTPIKCAVDAHLHHNLQPGDVVAWPTNLGWMMGPWLIFATLMNQGTVAIYEDAPFGAGFGKFIQDAKVTMLGIVPSMVRLWRARQSMESFDWSAIKCFSSTGEASNADDMFYLSWLAGMKPIIEYCGGTEIGGGYISSTVIQPNAPATFSTPAFGLDLRILDDQGNSAEEGELFLVPPSLGLSVELLNRDHHQTYFEDCPEDESGQVLRRHGDFFRRLPGGYFAAGGRADDTMNLGGIKVSSVEIETVLNQLEEVSETAAVAVPFDETGPDQLVVFYVLGEGVPADQLDTETLMRQMNGLIRSHLNPLFKIRSIERKDSLPRTASNKVMRRLLRDEFRDATK